MSEGRKILESMGQHNYFVAAAAQGASPRAIKSAIVKLLTPFVRNHAYLEESAHTTYVNIAVNVLNSSRDRWEWDRLHDVLWLYHDASALDQEAFYAAEVRFEHQVQRGIREYYRALHFEVPHDEITLESLRFEGFRLIGMLLEASLQPLLRSMHFQIQRLKQPRAPTTLVPAGPFGQIVRMLHESGRVRDFLAPPPFGVLVHHWRNAAQHHDTDVVGDKVVAHYCEGQARQTIAMSRDELLTLMRKMVALVRIANTARELALLDDLDTAAKYRDHAPDPIEDQDLVTLHAELSVWGLNVRSVATIGSQTTVTATVVGAWRPEQGATVRMTMLAYRAWVYHDSSTLTLRLLDQGRAVTASVLVKSEDCVAMESGRITQEEFVALAKVLWFDVSTL